ncbi:MAG: SDR family oxidoreductase [Pseudomonadota bacterium]
MNKKLLSIGHGYSARALARLLVADGWEITGTTRSAEKAEEIAATGVTPLIWPGADLAACLQDFSHVLLSAAPGPEGDPVLAQDAKAFEEAAPQLRWVGYLSTTGVYGDQQGGWVDETTPLTPGTRRGQARVEAETGWSAIPGLPLHIFRLAGIYGPGRGPFAKVRDGSARLIIKENQFFSRIHVEDIAQALCLSLNAPEPGGVYNLCDDLPAPPEDVIAHAAALLGLPRPPEVDFETADMSPMARSFYAESKKVRNDRIRAALHWQPRYPDYRAGLAALLALERGAT